MASILPSRIQDLLTFCEQHGELWNTVAAQVGLSSAQASAVKAAATAGRTNFNAANAANEAKLAAYSKSQDTIDALRTITGDAIRTIKAFAEQSGNPSAIYQIAQIPAPSAGTVMPPPGQPTDLTVAIEPTTGALKLAWKVTNPAGSSGTSYIIRRKLLTQTAWTFVGVTGRKYFTDTTFAAGPDNVQYTVQAQRSDASGTVSTILLVNFGTPSGGGGFTIASQGVQAAGSGSTSVAA